MLSWHTSWHENNRHLCWSGKLPPTLFTAEKPSKQMLLNFFVFFSVWNYSNVDTGLFMDIFLAFCLPCVWMKGSYTVYSLPLNTVNLLIWDKGLFNWRNGSNSRQIFSSLTVTCSQIQISLDLKIPLELTLSFG